MYTIIIIIILSFLIMRHLYFYIKNNLEYESFCQRHEIDLISINTTDGYVEPLVEYMNKRITRH